MVRLISIIFISGASGFCLNRARNSPRLHLYGPQQLCKSSTLLKNDLRDEIENAAQRRAYENRARGDGVGSTAAGAILGGLLGGPFGALVRMLFNFDVIQFHRHSYNLLISDPSFIRVTVWCTDRILIGQRANY